MSEINPLNYIYSEELKKFYYKIQNLFPICLKCKKAIFLYNIKENIIVKTKIECPFCKTSEILPLRDYIDKLESFIPEKKYCKEHNDNLSYGFCQDCNIWLCRQCFINHMEENKNHDLYQSQFKIRPTCLEHPKEKASFYDPEKNIYLCNKCNFKPILNRLTNAYFYNLQGNEILSKCFHCLYYKYDITEAKKVFNKLDILIKEYFKNQDELGKEKFEKIKIALDLINKNKNEVIFTNAFIANSYLKNMPNYHIFKNIKNNCGINFRTWYDFNDIIIEIEDKEKEKNMTKKLLLELLDKFIFICENNIAKNINSELSERNMLFFPDESKLKVKEIKSFKIDEDNEVSKGFELEKGKSFIIYSHSYFIIYDSNTYELILKKDLFNSLISNIYIINHNRFIVSFSKHYELYEFKDKKCECLKIVQLQRVNQEEMKKLGIEIKEEIKEEYDNDNNKSDEENDRDLLSKNKNWVETSGINGIIYSIALLKDETKIAIGHAGMISIREFNTGKAINALIKHEGIIEFLFTFENYLISSCSCNQICIWNLNTFELKESFETKIISYTILNNGNILIGNYRIQYLDTVFLDIDQEFSGHFIDAKGLIQLNEEEVLIAAEEDYLNSSTNFYLLNIYTSKINLHMKNIYNNNCVGCFKIDDNKFISIFPDNTIKVWRIKNENYKSVFDYNADEDENK